MFLSTLIVCCWPWTSCTIRIVQSEANVAALFIWMRVLILCSLSALSGDFWMVAMTTSLFIIICGVCDLLWNTPCCLSDVTSLPSSVTLCPLTCGGLIVCVVIIIIIIFLLIDCMDIILCAMSSVSKGVPMEASSVPNSSCILSKWSFNRGSNIGQRACSASSCVLIECA